MVHAFSKWQTDLLWLLAVIFFNYLVWSTQISCWVWQLTNFGLLYLASKVKNCAHGSWHSMFIAVKCFSCGRPNGYSFSVGLCVLPVWPHPLFSPSLTLSLPAVVHCVWSRTRVAPWPPIRGERLPGIILSTSLFSSSSHCGVEEGSN